MSDYSKMRMMELAGIKYQGVLMEDSQVKINADDVQSDEDAAWERERAIEKNINMIARQTGVELWDNYPVNIMDDGLVEVKVDTGVGMPLSHLLHFANTLASRGIGSDVQIQGSADLFITLSFKLV